MIYRMMMKVDFMSLKNVRKESQGLYVTLDHQLDHQNLLPCMRLPRSFSLSCSKPLIAPELATQYLAGAILLGAAPCTAMVFVWSLLTKGNPAYTVVQVATNDLIILIAFVPIVQIPDGCQQCLPSRGLP
jgi:ACR3 family arsenite transporter